MARNWFDTGAADYARFRPTYPDGLASSLAALAPTHRLALDAGCGNGQFTVALARHFDEVVGIDPSADQIGHAIPDARVRYVRAPAEALPVGDRSIALITAAQAAHWFDLPRFYAEVRRVTVQDGLLALISYGVMEVEPALRARFLQFYAQEVGPYWPAERRMVDEGYAGIDFPFAEQAGPACEIIRAWALADFFGYVSTWSAVRHARAAGKNDMLDAFARDMTDLWGDPDMRREVRWPVVMRLGIVD